MQAVWYILCQCDIISNIWLEYLPLQMCQWRKVMISSNWNKVTLLRYFVVLLWWNVPTESELIWHSDIGPCWWRGYDAKLLCTEVEAASVRLVHGHSCGYGAIYREADISANDECFAHLICAFRCMRMVVASLLQQDKVLFVIVPLTGKKNILQLGPEVRINHYDT